MDYNKFDAALQALNDAELAEMQAIGLQVRLMQDIIRVLEEVERVHGMAIDRETIIANLERVA